MSTCRWRDFPKPQPAIGIALIAIGIGVLTTFLPTVSAYLILAIISATGIGLGVRLILGRGGDASLGVVNRSKVDHQLTTAVDLNEHDKTARSFSERASEWLFYMGMLSIGLPALRIGWATLSDLLFFLALLLRLIRSGSHTESAPLPSLLVAGTTIYTLGALIATSASSRPLESLAVLARFVYILLVWFWLASTVLSNARKLERAAVLWVASAALSGAGSLGQLCGIHIFSTDVNFYNRMTGFTQHPNDLGGLTGIALLPALVLASRNGITLRVRIFSQLALCLVAFGLLLSGSVGGLIAAAVATVSWFSLADRQAAFRTIPLLALVAAILLISAAINLGDNSPIHRVATTTATDGSESATLWTREETNRAALEWLDLHPFIGAGLDSASRFTTTGTEVHNLLLGAWFTAGLLGLLGISTVLVSVFMSSRAVLRATAGVHLGFHRSMTAAFLGSLAFAMSAPIIYQRYAWTATALVLASRRLCDASRDLVVKPNAEQPLASAKQSDDASR
jgi:O-antigen ligase